MAGLHQHHLDFEILETGNLNTLVFIDSSDYMKEPEKPLLEITAPGYNKYFLVNVDARTVNTFNSSTIGFNQVFNQECLVELPDGVWQFKYKICPYKYVNKAKKYLRVTALLKKVENLYNQVYLGEYADKEDKDMQSIFVRLHILIEGAKAVVNINSKLAFEYYQLADRLVQKQLDKRCKNCK